MSEPFWLTRQIIVAIHDEQLTIHGGASGLRDEGLLEVCARSTEEPVGLRAGGFG